MLVGVFDGKLFQLSSVLLFTAALSACGGGGGGTNNGASSTSGAISPVSENTPEAITEQTYYSVAQMALAQIVSSTRSGASSVVTVETMSVRSPTLEPMAVSAADCDSGSGTENDHFQIPGEISNGDSFDSNHSNCKKSASRNPLCQDSCRLSFS